MPTVGRTIAGGCLLIFLTVLFSWDAQPQALGTNPGVAGTTRYVSSFNGRTGAVQPLSGDYSFALLSGAATASQVPGLASLTGQLGFGQIASGGASNGQVLCWVGGWTVCTLSQIGGQLTLSQLAQSGASSGNTPVWGGSSWGPGTPSGGGSGGTIDSVFGRTGAVIAQTGDYSYSQISGTPIFVDQITPSGSVNGVNINFTLPGTPNPTSSLYVWLNGMLMAQGIDYTVTGNSFFFIVSPPATGDILLASYRH
jgi:hypothetical protein